MVPLILLVTAVLCVSLSVLLVVVGVLAIVGQIEGGKEGGILTIVVAMLPPYLAYLFGRSAWRIRLNMRGVYARAQQRSTLKAVGGYTAFLIASDIFAPVPGALGRSSPCWCCQCSSPPSSSRVSRQAG